jgi:hypothetical protein
MTDTVSTVTNPVVLSDEIMRELLEHIQKMERDIKSLKIDRDYLMAEYVRIIKEIPF